MSPPAPSSSSLLRSTALLTAGRIAGYGLAFLRNLLLARLLTKSDYALAAVFSMAMMLLELSARMAFGPQVIQSKEGDSPAFLGTAHALQFIGGSISALLIVATCVPMAQLFKLPHIWWAFALLGCVPLAQGLTHLDISCQQRRMNFLPLVLVDVLPQLLTTLAVWPLYLWLQDFRVIVWVMIGKAALGAALSFALARQPYAWAWHRDHLRGMLRFGWPLLLTGLVMFGSQQADQMLVGAAFSLPELANYALAFSLVSTPWFILSQIMTSLMLPLMSQAQNDPARLQRQYQRCAEISSVGGILMMLPLMVAGEQIIMLFYGTKYAGSGVFMALLGAAAAVRFLRYAPAVAAMAKGDTINQLYSNLWRVASLPLALLVWQLGGSIILIAGCALAGEVLATVASLVLLHRRQSISYRATAGAIIFQGLFVALGLLFIFAGGIHFGFWAAVAVACGSLLITSLAAKASFPEVVAYLLDALRRKSAKA